jgi:hypothetical protein
MVLFLFLHNWKGGSKTNVSLPQYLPACYYCLHNLSKPESWLLGHSLGASVFAKIVIYISPPLRKDCRH